MLKTKVFTLWIIVSVCFALVSVTIKVPTVEAQGAEWWDTDFDYRRLITFNNTLSTENLINFTTLLKLDDDNFDFDKVDVDGDDLRFLDINGATQLDYELEKFYSTKSNDFPKLSTTTLLDYANASDYRKWLQKWGIVETDSLGGYDYWAYVYGRNVTDSGIGLMRSNSLIEDWVWYANDMMISDVSGASVIMISETEFYMFVANNTLYTIDRWSSSDGLTWSWDEIVVDPSDRDRAVHPHIKEYDDIYYLYYTALDYDGAASQQSIRVRGTVFFDALVDTEYTELLDYADEYAITAPSVEYFNDRYWLMVQAIPTEVSDNFNLLAYYCTTPDGTFITATDNPLVTPKEGAPFMWANDDNVTVTLYTTFYDDSDWIMVYRTFNVNENEAFIWIRVPQIDSESEVDGYYIYYGNDEATPDEDSENAWDDDYGAIYHFNSLIDEPAFDSAGYNNEAARPATPYVVCDQEAVANGGASVIDLGYFAATDHDELECTGNLTVWSLAKISDYSSNQLLVGKMYNEANSPMYHTSVMDNTGFPQVYTKYTTDTVFEGTINVFDEWTMITMVRDITNDSVTLYVNATIDGSEEDLSAQADLSNGGRLMVGAYEWSGARSTEMNGVIDEARVYHGALSAEWMEAEYLNIFDAWVSIGFEDARADYTNTIDLDSPADAYTAHSLTTTFVFTPQYTLSDPETAYFHTNATTWSIRNLIGSVTNATQSTYDYQFYTEGATYL